MLLGVALYLSRFLSFFFVRIRAASLASLVCVYSSSWLDSRRRQCKGGCLISRPVGRFGQALCWSLLSLSLFLPRSSSFFLFSLSPWGDPVVPGSAFNSVILDGFIGFPLICYLAVYFSGLSTRLNLDDSHGLFVRVVEFPWGLLGYNKQITKL